MSAPSSPPSIEQLLAHRSWLRRLARSLVTDDNEADDLEQDVWLKAMRRPPHTRKSLRGWLGTVVRRAAADRRRAAGRRSVHEARSAPGPGSETPLQRTARLDVSRQVARAVLALPPVYRDAVLRRYFAGYSVAEVAECEHVPLETARTRLRRALAMLRTRLDAQHEGRRTAWRAALLALANLPPPSSTAAGLAQVGVLGALSMSIKLTILALVVAVGVLGFLLHGGGPEEGTQTARVDEQDGAASGGPTLTPAQRDARERLLSGDDQTPSTATALDNAVEERLSRDAVALLARAKPKRITGRVVDVDGAPVHGARIFFERLVDGRAEPMPAGSKWIATSITDGWFWLDDLREGAYRLRVQAPGHATRLLPARVGAQAVTITLETAHSISGIVVERDTDKPVAGLLLIARPAASPQVGQDTLTRTDETGAFRIEPLPAGEFVVTFGCALVNGNDAGDEYQIGTTSAIKSDTHDVRIEAVRGEAIAGEVLGTTSTTRMTVEAIAEDDGGALRRWTYVGEDGRFRISGLVPGRYTIAAKPSSADKARHETTTAHREGVVTGTDDLILELGAGVALRGVLRNDDDEPVTGKGYVYVYPAGTSAGAAGAVVTRPDKDGRFETAALDPGVSYEILATGFPGHMQAKLEGAFPGQEEVTVRMPRAGSISGRVVDQDGKPAPAGIGVTANAEGDIDFTQRGTGSTAYTRAGGVFRIDGLGAYAFSMSAGGGSTAYVGSGALSGVKLGTQDVVLRVKLGKPLRGKLVDEGGQPVRTPYLAAHGPVGSGIASSIEVQTEDGRFKFPGVPEGPLTLICRIGDEFVNLGRFEPRDEEELVVTVPSR